MTLLIQRGIMAKIVGSITRLFRPPSFADPKQNLQARQLHYLLLLGLIITIAFPPLAYLTTQDMSGPTISGIMSLVIIILFWLLRRGQLQFVSKTLVFSSYFAIMTSLLLHGGIRDQSIVNLVMILTLAGVFLSQRVTVWLGVITSLAVIGLYILELMGFIVDDQYVNPSEFDDLLILLIAIISTTSFLNVIIHQIVKSEEQLRQQAAILRLKNKELQETQISLEERSTELSATLTDLQLTQQALIDAKEKAELANQAKSEFLSNMSHELRTPLNGILGYTQILQFQSGLDEDVEHGLNVIHTSGQHLLDLIKDLLDLAKIEARKMELYPSEIHLRSFLESIINITKMRADEKEISFVFEIEDDMLVGIQADVTRLRQILVNLLNNAIKFTDQGQVAFTVSTIGYQESHIGGQGSTAQIRFEISDTGVGMTRAEIQQVFQPFEQGGDSHSRSDGTGLGLAITRELLTLMGSELQLESIKGQGSRLWFDLSVLVSQAQPESSPQLFDTPLIIGYSGPRQTVLLVDDKTINRAILKRMLAPRGFQIIEAEHGQEALKKAEQYLPDIILMDLVMSRMDGFEAIQAIRQHPALAQVIIIAVSARAFSKDREQSYAAGADDFIPKPVEEKLLFDIISRYLNVEWIFSVSDELKSDDEPQARLIPPPTRELQTLYELAKMGKMRGIREAVDTLEQMDEQLIPFAKYVRELSRTFEDKRILKLIESYLVMSE